MRTKLARLTTIGFALWLTAFLFLGMQPAMAQGDDPRDQVERVVIDLVRAEQNSDLDRLYDYLVPESRNMIPRQAFMTWFAEQDYPVPSGVPTVEDIELDNGIYDLTGTEYKDMAIVRYTVPVEGSDEPESREIAMWSDGVTWRWFFDASEDEAEEIRDDAEFTVDYESPYSTDIYRQLDTYWAQIFADHGAEYHSPVDMVGVRVLPLETACGDMSEEDIESNPAFYCGWDETIYYRPAFRSWVIDEFGEYAWHHVIAHEWGHHVQNVLGLFTSVDPELYGGSYTIEHELQADCLAAMFTQDTFSRGTIDDSDVTGAEEITAFVGDRKGTPWDNQHAHGSADQRVESFWLGFDDGLRGCYITISTDD
jgi:uncharacterized protein